MSLYRILTFLNYLYLVLVKEVIPSGISLAPKSLKCFRILGRPKRIKFQVASIILINLMVSAPNSEYKFEMGHFPLFFDGGSKW